jgi:hypothetical protein
MSDGRLFPIASHLRRLVERRRLPATDPEALTWAGYLEELRALERLHPGAGFDEAADAIERKGDEDHRAAVAARVARAEAARRKD